MLRAAADDARAAWRWCRERDAEVAEGFLAEYDRILVRIGETPDGSAPHIDGTRRLGMMRFPHSIEYRVKNDVVEVVAVAHQRRRPGYWKNRAK